MFARRMRVAVAIVSVAFVLGASSVASVQSEKHSSEIVVEDTKTCAPNLRRQVL